MYVYQVCKVSVCVCVCMLEYGEPVPNDEVAAFEETVAVHA